MAVRRGALAAGVLMTVLAVSACSARSTPPRDEVPHDAPSGGQTLAQMQAAVHALPGVTVTEADGGGAPNVKGNTGYTFAISVDEGHVVTDAPALVTYLVESAWSVREGYRPNTYVTISVRDGGPEPVDVEAAAMTAGWVSPRRTTGPSHGYSVVNVVLSEHGDGPENLRRLGPWPGSVPEPPGGLTTTRQEDDSDGR